MLFVDNFLHTEGSEYEGGAIDAVTGAHADPGLLRPFMDSKGRKCVTLNTGKMEPCPQTGILKPVRKTMLVNKLLDRGITNGALLANTTLRKDEWLQLDQVIIRAARQRLRAWSDLLGANQFGGFNAMAKMILEHETMSDPGVAVVDMDGIAEGRADTPLFQLEGLPLPITHCDFWYSSRRLAVSRNTGTPLDTAMGEAAGRRVAETIERTLIGITTGVTYGVTADYGRAPTVYGYTNFPDRVVKADMTAPDGTNGPTILSDWLAMRELMYANLFYGPFMVYVSNDYDEFLDNLFSTTEPSAGTLRKRLMEIDGINGIRRLDFLPGSSNNFEVIFVQMTPDVARAINGMDITTVQWESRGGMQVNFKVMAIQVPQLRADYNGRCGIGHGTTP